MTTSKQSALALAIALAIAAPAWAQAQQDPHHPADGRSGSAAPAAPAKPAADMPMMGMMMQMMRHHGMSGTGMSAEMMPGMHMADRIEGRLAFLKTELKITDAQSAVWNDFAAALRGNAKKLGDARKAAPVDTGSAAPSLVAQLGQQETWYAARLEGIRTIKAAFERLYQSLAESQRETADQLMPAHLGLGSMGGMAMSERPMGMGMGGMPMTGGGKP